MDEIRSSLAENFSLTRGGPFYRLQVRWGRREGEHERVILRALLATIVAWLPMLILSLVQGLAFGSQVKVPFLHDIGVNVRFLVALPILILAESTIDKRWRILVLEFLRSGLLRKPELPAFEAVIEKINRLRDHVLPETVMLLLAYLPVILAGKIELLQGISTWHSGDKLLGISPAGWWFNLVGTPLFRFLFYRWGWRILLWTLFLWRVSKLKLYLVATHSDGAAGLGFLSEGQKVFSSIVFAGSAVVAGHIANVILYEGATLSSLKWHMVAYGVMAITALILPLVVVAPVLHTTKKRALFEFGGLVTKHDQLFETKWIHGNHPLDEVILGNPDASSLIDLGSSYAVVLGMSVVPIDKNTLIGLAVAAALPMLIVVLFVTPANEVIGAVLKVLS
jgi:hypothetical protein